MGNKQVFKGGGELVDYPGSYMIQGGSEDGSDQWGVVRKPDGSWWWVAATDIFPRSGGNMHVDLGDEVTDEKMLTQCEEQYRQILQERDKKRTGTA